MKIVEYLYVLFWTVVQLLSILLKRYLWIYSLPIAYDIMNVRNDIFMQLTAQNRSRSTPNWNLESISSLLWMLTLIFSLPIFSLCLFSFAIASENFENTI